MDGEAGHLLVRDATFGEVHVLWPVQLEVCAIQKNDVVGMQLRMVNNKALLEDISTAADVATACVCSACCCCMQLRDAAGLLAMRAICCSPCFILSSIHCFQEHCQMALCTRFGVCWVACSVPCRLHCAFGWRLGTVRIGGLVGACRALLAVLHVDAFCIQLAAGDRT